MLHRRLIVCCTGEPARTEEVVALRLCVAQRLRRVHGIAHGVRAELHSSGNATNDGRLLRGIGKAQPCASMARAV
jgi:hypothetical protein